MISIDLLPSGSSSCRIFKFIYISSSSYICIETVLVSTYSYCNMNGFRGNAARLAVGVYVCATELYYRLKCDFKLIRAENLKIFVR